MKTLTPSTHIYPMGRTTVAFVSSRKILVQLLLFIHSVEWN